MGPHILVVDEDRDEAGRISDLLRAHHLGTVTDSAEIQHIPEMIAHQGCSLLLLSVDQIQDREGLIELLAREHSGVATVVLTSHADVESAVACLQMGACDYLEKPVSPDRLLRAVQGALGLRRIPAYPVLERRGPVSKQDAAAAFSQLISVSPHMQAVFAYVRQVAPLDHPILIAGEPGTGKSLMAQAIHRLSGRRGRFVAANVAGVADSVFSDTLFGQHLGACNGASRAGLVPSASAGTLFLDGIAELCPASQIKLLRLMQEGTFMPAGCDHARFASARIIVATTQRHGDSLGIGGLHADLAHLLRAHVVEMPPLRSRPRDIPLIIEHLIDRFAIEGRPRPQVPDEVYRAIAGYPFPDNDRELESIVADAVLRTTGSMLDPEPFERMVRAARPAETSLLGFSETLPTLAQADALLIKEALRRAENNQARAARMLGISRQALNKRINANREKFTDVMPIERAAMTTESGARPLRSMHGQNGDSLGGA